MPVATHDTRAALTTTNALRPHPHTRAHSRLMSETMRVAPFWLRRKNSTGAARSGSGTGSGAGCAARNAACCSPYSRTALFLRPAAHPLSRPLHSGCKRGAPEDVLDVVAGQAQLLARLLERAQRLEPDERRAHDVVAAVLAEEVDVVRREPDEAVAQRDALPARLRHRPVAAVCKQSLMVCKSRTSWMSQTCADVHMTFLGPNARMMALVAPASVTAPVSKYRFGRSARLSIELMT